MKFTLLFSSILLFSQTASNAAVSYNSVNSAAATTSLSNDLIEGLSPTSTPGNTGGDPGANVDFLTDGVTATVSTGRVFVNSGATDYDLGGTFRIETIYFRLVNAVVDDRLSYEMEVLFSSNNGATYTPVFTIDDQLENSGIEFATTGTLTGFSSSGVTNIRFNLINTGFNASFSEIDVVGVAVPELSPQFLALFSLGLGIGLLRRR